jgi:hypothetical protein
MVRGMKWLGNVLCMRKINSYKNLVAKLKGKRPPGIHRHRWKDRFHRIP